MITLSALLKKNIEKLSTLEEDNETAIDWFKINEMIVNLDKFQAINSESFLKLL